MAAVTRVCLFWGFQWHMRMDSRAATHGLSPPPYFPPLDSPFLTQGANFHYRSWLGPGSSINLLKSVVRRGGRREKEEDEKKKKKSLALILKPSGRIVGTGVVGEREERDEVDAYAPGLTELTRGRAGYSNGRVGHGKSNEPGDGKKKRRKRALCHGPRSCLAGVWPWGKGLKGEVKMPRHSPSFLWVGANNVPIVGSQVRISKSPPSGTTPGGTWRRRRRRNLKTPAFPLQRAGNAQGNFG